MDNKSSLLYMGNRIKQQREFLNMSQEELANKVGYNSTNARSSINKIEKGKSDIPSSKIEAIAKALGVTPAYIMGWDSENKFGRHCFEIITFGNRLKQIRGQNNMTLDELAAKYNSTYGGGLNKGTLSKYENGKQEPLVSTVVNLANLLNVTVDYFLQEVITNEI